MEHVAVKRTASGRAEIEEISFTPPVFGLYAAGIIGLAWGIFVLGACYAQWLTPPTLPAAQFLAAATAGVLPIVVGILIYATVREHASLATAFTLSGVVTLSSLAANRLLVLLSSAGPGDISGFMGMTFLLDAIVLAYVSASLWRKYVGIAMTLGAFGLSLFVLSIGQWVPSTGWTIAAGYCCLVTALIGAVAAVNHRFPALLR